MEEISLEQSAFDWDAQEQTILPGMVKRVHDDDPFDELKVDKVTVEKEPKKVKPVEKPVKQAILKNLEKKPTKEELDKARNIKQKIRLYKQHFPTETKDINIGALDSMSLTKLNDKLQECKMAVNAANPSGLISLTYGTGIGIIENLSVFTPFRLQGLSLATSQNEAIKKALLELEIEYGDFNAIESPEKRLAIATLQQMWLVHRYNNDKVFQQSVNQQFENQEKLKQERVPENIEKQFVDI